MADLHTIPATPQVIAPSPTASEYGGNTSDSQYFPPVTRSSAKRTTSTTTTSDSKEGDDLSRARSRSRESTTLRRRISGFTPTVPTGKPLSRQSSIVQKSKPIITTNGHAKEPSTEQNANLLSPASAWAQTGSSYWRALSRSPSPLGLIPIHRHWRSFVHRHEVPRKLLHVSIGFLTLYLYALGLQQDSIHPWLLAALIPIVSVEFLRHRSESFNRLYVKVCGALMRETEVHDRYNGVIWYLAGVWAGMRFFPKDVAVLSVLLLSWCDTAASTFGRLYGRYTPRIRKGKSLAGTLAALVMGMLTAGMWYGLFVPAFGPGEEKEFMFQGRLSLPASVRNILGVSKDRVTVEGVLALALMSLMSGIIASLSELVDLYGLDDNITIPILSGLGLWAFLAVFA